MTLFERADAWVEDNPRTVFKWSARGVAALLIVTIFAWGPLAAFVTLACSMLFGLGVLCSDG